MRFRRLRIGDEEKLINFYHGLSPASIRTFCPLGVRTTLEAVQQVARDNRPWVNQRYDLVIQEDSRLVGWSFIWHLKTAETMFGLAVADDFHGRGLGKRLIGGVMSWAQKHQVPKVYLTVVQDNTVAVRLYENFGFVRYGEMVGEDGLDYFKMEAIPPYVTLKN